MYFPENLEQILSCSASDLQFPQHTRPMTVQNFRKNGMCKTASSCVPDGIYIRHSCIDSHRMTRIRRSENGGATSTRATRTSRKMGYVIYLVSYSCQSCYFLLQCVFGIIISSLLSTLFSFVSDRDQCGKCRAGTRRLNLNKYCRRDYGTYYWKSVAYPGIIFGGGGSTNSVEDRGQRGQGSGGGSPLVRGSGGSCNLVQEISFHIVRFS